MKKHQLLQELYNLQVNSSNNGYLDGIFASQRYHPFLGYKREDENVFFSSAITYTLQEHLSHFNKEEKILAKKIIDKTIRCYPHFENFKGGITYNFFKTHPMDYFPNGFVMHRFKQFKLADDADDTAYVYLTDKQQNQKSLKKKLIKHANGTLTWNTFLPEGYKSLKAYSVYFGKKMHIEIDVCVLSNILLWNFAIDLPLKRQDKDSLLFIEKAVRSKDYITKPYLVSPCYPTTSQVCYHISRLIGKYMNKNPTLTHLKPILIKDILKYKEHENTTKVDELLLNISLLNLNIEPEKTLDIELDEFIKNTSFFYTSIPLMVPNQWMRSLQKYSLLNRMFGLRTQCTAYTISLLIEYLALKDKKMAIHQP
ncbi:hypothetical protein ACXGQW_05070 [Wenyingzhuangia sp. IMCC45533]